ncbi:unnamed protein product [Miscanthus lutarioriparius]|uniref:Uncharacterized protein n=1 Tax=Miscanthus lutarioriparius TaxID=422564 RepID=A0A811M7E2_9POAL|nr:unnamed protein product [Miscanthus lutarioriparius]
MTTAAEAAPLRPKRSKKGPSSLTARLETKTEFDRDVRAIRERQLKQAHESLKKNPSGASVSASGEVYKGIHGYTDYKAREPFVDPVVTKCKHYFCEHCGLKDARNKLRGQKIDLLLAILLEKNDSFYAYIGCYLAVYRLIWNQTLKSAVSLQEFCHLAHCYAPTFYAQCFYHTQDEELAQHQVSMLLFLALACGIAMFLFTKVFGTQVLTAFTGSGNLFLGPVHMHRSW